MSDLPPVRISHPHVEVIDYVLAGSPLVRGTKVPVRRIYSWHKKGVSAETLVKRYAQLGPARVFDALAFAYDNLDVLEADLERERHMLDEQYATQLPLPRRGSTSAPPKKP